MIPTNVHSFSRSFVNTHNITPSSATLLKHIAYKVSTSKNVHDGKSWHYNSASKLQTKLPYLSASTISAQIKVLEEKGFLEIGNYNRWKHDRTQWYHVPDHLLEEVEDDLIKFDAGVAKDFGILAAVLHFNLFHFIRKQIKKKLDMPKHTMSPKALATHLPFSESAIKNALKKLWTGGLIIKLNVSRSTYSLPVEDRNAMGQA